MIGILIVAGAIIHKAGYPLTWLLLAFLPFVNVVMALVFAFSDWPLLREIRFQKLDPANADPEDGPAFLREVLRFELEGDTAKALNRYQKLQDVFAGQPVAEDARIAWETLQEKMGQQKAAQASSEAAPNSSPDESSA